MQAGRIWPLSAPEQRTTHLTVRDKRGGRSETQHKISSAAVASGGQENLKPSMQAPILNRTLSGIFVNQQKCKIFKNVFPERISAIFPTINIFFKEEQKNVFPGGEQLKDNKLNTRAPTVWLKKKEIDKF